MIRTRRISTRPETLLTHPTLFRSRALDNLVRADDRDLGPVDDRRGRDAAERAERGHGQRAAGQFLHFGLAGARGFGEAGDLARSEEHTSELQSQMRNSYAVFCWKKKKRRES